MKKLIIFFSTIWISLFGQVAQEELFKFDQKKWNETRTRIENNQPLFEEERSTVTAAPPILTPTTIEFMEGTQLSIAGRKLIGMEVKTVQYPHRPEHNRTDINMKQELQVNIRGKVGKNVDVNIDIDDTQPDKRDISIIYRGEGVEAQPGAVGYKARPGTFIQEAAFGDIQLSLPNTEFVGYSRQVFGLKVIAQYNNAKLHVIASQAKGNYETKRFTGKTEFERKVIYDTSYIRRKYYKIIFGNYKIRRDTVRIVVDTLDPQRDPTTLRVMTVQAFNVPSSTYTGKFEELALGKDYFVDYVQGIIIFNKSIQSNYIIAVDYFIEDSEQWLSQQYGNGNYIMIKDRNETEGITTELKNRYYLGRTNIIRDDGTGNFILKITDKSDRPLNPGTDKILPDGKDVPVYLTGNLGNIKVDFENGEIYFDIEKPFAEDCYYKTPLSRYNILVEYRYRTKTYFLKPFIVPYSERITLNGRPLQRNVDYWIDYDSGFITFLNEEEITETSIIEVGYEYSMLGLQAGETIAGGRLEVPLSNKLFVGGSWIGNLPSKGSSVPDVRTTPSSLQVWEADARIIDVKIPLLPLRINSFSGEYAESIKNPNIWDKAVLENMEGITLEDSVSTYRHTWYYSSCSDVYIPGSYDSNSDKYIGGELNWENEELLSKEINPNIDSEEKRQVLKINYNLYSSSEVAMVYQFSRTGLDFSKKMYIEIELYSNGGGGEFWLDLGHVSEDIDQDKILDTEDKNSNGRLDEKEDVGFSYNREREYKIGLSNGKLDSEDIDNDGLLFGVDKITDRYKVADLNFTGWISTIVPINIANKSLWTSVKDARIRIKGHGKTGIVKIGKISVVGNKFEIATPQNTRIFAVNNENDPFYKKLSELEEYSSIYGTREREEIIEQTLAIEYNFDNRFSSSVVNLSYTRGLDFTFHHKLNFFVFNKTENDIILRFRAYTDINNYFEYATPISRQYNEWKKISVEQVDINNDNIPDKWDAIIGDNAGVCSIKGTPKLHAITKIEIIVENPPGITSQQGVIYINDIYLSESWKRKGIARKLELNMSIPNWASFGGMTRSVERDFETFTMSITNQDNVTNVGFFNFTRLGFMPVSFHGKQEETITPSAIKSGELVSKLEEGERLYTEGKVDTSLLFNRLPQININYTKSVSSTTELRRLDIKDTYRTNLSYNNPLRKYIPVEKLSVTYGEEKFLLYTWNVVTTTYYPSVDNSKFVNFGLPFNFWDKISLSLNAGVKNTFTELRQLGGDINEKLVIPRLKPDSDIIDYYSKLTFFTMYNLYKTYELYYTTYSIVISSYEKRNEYGAEANTTLNFVRFFRPNLGYRVELFEDFNFPIATKKDVTRNMTGSFSVNLAPVDILRLKYIESLKLYYNFNLTAGDKYESLPKDFRSPDFFSFKNLDLLWYKTEITTTTLLRRRMLERNDQKLTGGWKIFEGVPFSGNLEFLKKTDVNFSYSDSKEEKEEMQTKTLTYTKVWPDLTSTFYNLEDLAKFVISQQKVVRDTRLDITYTYRTTEIRFISFEQGIRHREVLSFDLFDNYQIVSSYERMYSDLYNFKLSIITMMSYTDIIGLQVGMPFFGQRLTPRYEYKKEYAEDARKLPTKDIITHTFSVTYYADIVPAQGGLQILGKKIPLQNRLRINSTLTYVRKESPIDIAKNNTDQINFLAKADYDISKYINISFGLGTDVNINRVVKTETNYAYSAQGQVIIRF
ncbi:MAG: hypothetical protein N2555_03775 [Endomicrobia bacterium]|nr:hypothetical protein [Endomicrobiia bacterium]